MVLLIYRILFPFAFLLALPFYALRLMRRERGRASQAKPENYHLGLGQRLAHYDAALRERLASAPPPVWLCSISVGETLVALKLARAIRQRDPAARVLISVTTSTGFELLLREVEKLPWIIPLYNPLDFYTVARAALRAVRPSSLVLIEGGIWPNFLAAARSLGIRIVLANARLSPRSERRWQHCSAVARPVWSLFDLVCVPLAEDVARWEGIGVEQQRIRVTGNVKFDNESASSESQEQAFRSIVQAIGLRGPILLAGSTWAPEEMAIAAAFMELRREWPTLGLIIIPRHVERANAIERDLSAAGLQVVRRSIAEAATGQVLLVDTTGELRDWYRVADVAFVGKSLPGIAEIGGQNFGEPAALGLPVLFGPHVENFAALATHLLENNAAIQIPDSDALVPIFRELLGDSAIRIALGQRAQSALATHQGAATRTVEHLGFY